MRLNLRFERVVGFEIDRVEVEERLKFTRGYLVELKCVDASSESIFDVTETLNVEEVSFVVVDGEADLVSV
jgi:hypothetical protein